MAPFTINVLLSSFPGLALPATLAIPLPSTSSIADLTDRISAHLPFPLTAQSSPLILTTTNNKQISFSSPAKLSNLIPDIVENGVANTASTFLPLRLSVRVCGGKGGFGSQLRAAGGRMSSRRKGNQDTNTGSNRNLDGRRLRTVKEAKALAEYLALKPEMDRKEKEARKRRWEAAVAAAEKKEQEIRNGEGKGKVDGAWMEDKEEMSEKAREAVLQAMAGGAWKDNLAGLLDSAEASGSSGSGGSMDASEDSDMEDIYEEDSPNEPSASTKKPVRRFFGFDYEEDDEDLMSEDEEDEIDETDTKGKGKARSRNILHRSPITHRKYTFIRCLSEWRALQPYRASFPSSTAFPLAPRQQRQHNSTESLQTTGKDLETWALPDTCHGCGALTQWVYPKEPGYYTVTRKPVKQYIRHITQGKQSDVDASPIAAYENKPAQESKEPEHIAIPLCDRCHNLINHGEGEAIPYPTLSYIRDLIEESPFHNNYIYHVVDAADFPLSVIPNLQRYVPIQPQRSQNRRSHTKKYGSSRYLAELNFVITRADLLSNVKPQADSLMKHMVEILRQTLDRKEHGIRLGNVHMVSSYRGWWTKEIKQDIWNQGGGVWMVGKVNVGKSKLITSVFPKTAPAYKARKLQNSKGITIVGRSTPPDKTNVSAAEELEDEEDGVAVLLPPLQKEVPFPNLPIDSVRPGTTASPIRIPFDKHRGEVIDLPGLFRSGLDEFVRDKHKSDLVMTSRPRPTQLTIKPAQSLLLGGLIGIKPLEENEIFLASPFVSLEPHTTHKDKAAEMLAQQRECPTGNIAKEGIGEQITSAGIVELKYDVTARYAKPLPNGDLPSLYRIMGVDILIEGCGWVELTCQVRTRTREPEDFPRVELFSPQGKFVGSRMPLSTYAFSLKHRAQEENKRMTRSMRPAIKRHSRNH
ncbi:hypothetical protein H106_08489 [Trichophyton rubrum CBS 735.88]|nr:hypothetical protein H106_08489 [Trichophyton rubrum CBS 735.88]